MLTKESFIDFLYKSAGELDDDSTYASLSHEFEGSVAGEGLEDYENDDFLLVQSPLVTEGPDELYNELYLFTEDGVKKSSSIVSMLKQGVRAGLIKQTRKFNKLPLDELITKIADIQKDEPQRRFWVLYRGTGHKKVVRLYEFS